MADSRQSHDADDAVLTGLARLSATLAVDPPPDQLVIDVQARIGALPTPAAHRPVRQGLAELADRLRRHWRAATAVAVALLLGILAVSPAGARIAQWLGIGGVRIVQEVPQSTGPPDPAAADGFTEVDLDQARARVSFPLAVPADLGPPTRVLIGPADTVVSMVWAGGDPIAPDGPVRLDQLAGRPDPAVIKSYIDDLEFPQVGGQTAYWLRAPHPLVYTDQAGTDHTERSRTAGPTLIWQDGPVTFRLEGVGSQQRAVQIAGSVA